MENAKALSPEKTKKVFGGDSWSRLGKLAGGLATGGAGGAGLGTAICGPVCGIVGGVYGAMVGVAAAEWDVRK